VTNEQRKAYIKALLEEKQGYEARGLADKAAAVEHELRLVGHEAMTPQERASRRPAPRSKKAATR
jgi:hypothetical protein